MSKILITKKNLHKYLDENDRNFYVSKQMILSPGVKDTLDEREIKLVYVNSDDSILRKEDIIKNIYRLLKVDFNIKDDNEIEKITSKVLEKIKN